MNKLIPAFLIAAMVACGGKPTWTEHKAGPVSMQFPCKPSTAAAVTKCIRSDGSTFALAIVQKDVPDEEELKQTKEYADGIPNGELIKMDAFPLKWREKRRAEIVDSVLYYKGGVEYVVSLAYTSEKPPDIAEEFFAKVKFE